MSNKDAAAPKASGRPPVLADADVVFVDGFSASTILQAGSDRRAIVNKLVDLGGRATVKELSTLFGFDVRAQLLALMREGWVGAGKLKRKKAIDTMPRRSKSMMAA